MRVRLSNNFIKQLVAAMFAVAVILLGVYVGSGDAKSVHAEDWVEDASGKFGYVTYKSKDTVKEYVGNKAPETKAGYVFAGWYMDAKCTEAIKNDAQVNETNGTTFYAKYVPEGVLSTKAQISENIGGDTDTRTMRFVSSVDELNYQTVGFALKYQENNSNEWQAFRNEGKYVFSRIEANTDTAEYKFSPKVVDTKSEYFITATWKGADELGLTNGTGTTTDFNTNYYVRAYWVTMDGVTVYGPVRYVSVNDGLNSNIINVAVKGATTQSGTVSVSGYEGATGTVAYHDGTYSHVRIDLGTGKDRSAVLKSVTKFTVDGKDVYYRNLYTKYDGTTASVDTSWYSVYGQNAGDYVIATSADLYGLPALTNPEDGYRFANQTVYVIADIEVNKGTATPTGWNGAGGTAYPWTPIIEFYGTFDGQGHKIEGIQVQQSSSYCGFFGYTNSGENVVIKNFRLENSYFGQSAGYGLGSIVGYGKGGTIQNVYSDAYVNKSGSAGFYSGGIVGYNTTSPITIENCCYEGTLTTSRAAGGGILGKAEQATADIKDCIMTGTINTSANEIGGIVGTAATTVTKLTITDCLFDGTINIDTNIAAGTKYIGGIVGTNKAPCDITTCLNSGEFTYTGSATINGICRAVGVNSHASMYINQVYFTNEGFNGGEDYYSSVTMTKTPLVYKVAEADISGKYAFFNTSLNFDENGKWALVADGTPVLKTFAAEVPALPEVPEDVNIDWYKGVESSTYTLGDSANENDANVNALKGLSYLVSEGITFAGKL